jgi:hypothetical protein
VTLQQWLQEATGTFPAGVQKRLAQEYRAHLEESVAAGGIGDPVVLFGEPKIIQQQLEKSYVQVGRIDELRSVTGFYFWLSMSFCLVATVFVFQFLNNNPLRTLTVTTFTTMLLVWKWTLHWPRIKQIAFRNLISWPLMCLFIFAFLFVMRSNLHLLYAYIVLSTLLATLGGFREYARLRRTLALESQP